MFSLTKTTSRQRDILEVLIRSGWDYMRSLIAGTQTGEPQLPTPAVLKNILIDLGPVYVKLGQLLSTRPDLLPASYIEELSTLQANVPPVTWTEIEIVLRRQLPVSPLEKVFQSIDTTPIAAGSIAQIHKAILIDGRQVVMKIQRPGIDDVIAQDISLIKAIAELVSLSDFGQDYDIIALADEFAKALQAELDFRQEAHHTNQLRRNLSQSKWFDTEQLVIPEIYWDITTEKILVMEWLDGVPLLLADFTKIPVTEQPSTLPPTPLEINQKKREISTLLFRAFLQQMFIDGFFHADPHPGNIFYLRNGKVALLDFGMVGRLDPRTQQILTEMILAIVDIDAKRCAQLTLELSEAGASVAIAKLQNDYDRMLRKYYNRNLAEINFSEAFYEVLAIARENKIRLPGNLGLYAKALANLEGVARSFDPEINLLDQIKPLMTDLFRHQFLGENPSQTLLRTALDLKRLSLQSPRQIELFLDRLTSETLSWNMAIKEMEPLRRSVDDSANRLSFSVVVGSLVIGAAIVTTNAKTPGFSVLSEALFGAASLLGLWLIVSILRSGRLK